MLVKILILRFSSIGDIILTSPVIRCLKEQIPELVLHYGIKEKYAWILDANPYVDEIKILKEGKLLSLIRSLRQENYDFIIDLHHNIRSFCVKKLLKSRSYSFYKLNLYKWLLVSLKWDIIPRRHVVDRYMDTVFPLGVQSDGKGLDYFIPSSHEISLSTLAMPFQKGYIAYAMGGQYGTKRLPFHKMVELLQKIPYPVILLGDEGDRPLGDRLRDYFQQRDSVKAEMIWNACGLYSFHGSVSLLRQAALVFTHDTGLMHAAAAFGKKIFSMWGNTMPAFGMYPYQTDFVVLENTFVSCRPCSRIGYKSCPKKHFKCMSELSLNFVLPKLNGLKKYMCTFKN
ncbi:MAG: glycosyltransferase family 9 protein [Cytophagales bacterium]|nr:glycosyltransferase family 9 protein [Cytophagales bacterium]